MSDLLNKTEKAIERMPAEAEKTVRQTEAGLVADIKTVEKVAIEAPQHPISTARRFWRSLGPGFITGSSDDDPTAIMAYTQAGAQFGYGQLWTTLFTVPLMVAVQAICGRIGMVTGRGLAGVIREHYGRNWLYFAVSLLLFANIINIGADLGAMAASAQLIINWPFEAWLAFIVAIILALEIGISYQRYSQLLKYFAIIMLSYLVVTFMVHQDWSLISRSTFIPNFSFNKVFLLSLVAILGTNISPYLFFWQTGEEVEEEVESHKVIAMGHGVPKVNKREIRQMNMDTLVGMIFSNIILFFVCIAAASTLGVAGLTNISTAKQAAEALRPLAGNASSILFTVGILGSGLLAIPVLSGSTSYAITETFRWKEGLYRSFSQAHAFYFVIIVATIVGALINFSPIPPFRMLYYAAALNGVLAPPLLIIIMFIGSNKKIMGQFTTSLRSNILGWLTTVLMTIAAIALLVTMLVK